MEDHTTIAVDLSKSVFEIAVSQSPGRVCERRRLSRGQVVKFFANRPAATVLLEACGSAHHWARQIQPLGHRVLLLPPHQTRRYVLRDKTDGADANALLEAHRNEQIFPVPVKTLHQQALAALHRIRSGWMGARVARLNAIRGILRELGLFIPQGARHVLPRLSTFLADSQQPIPGQFHPTLLALVAEVRTLDQNIRDAEKQLAAVAANSPDATRYLTVPGIGLITATALVAFVGPLDRFRSGRRFASSLGLVPRESSSGLRRHLGSITKRGDPYLRTLVIHGARSVLLAASRVKTPRPAPGLGPLHPPPPRIQPRRRRSGQQTRPHRLGRLRSPDRLPEHPRLRRRKKHPASERAISRNDEGFGRTDTGSSRKHGWLLQADDQRLAPRARPSPWPGAATLLHSQAEDTNAVSTHLITPRTALY